MKIDIENYFGTTDIKGGYLVPCSDQYCGKQATCYTPIKLGFNTLFVPLCEEHAGEISHAINILPQLAGEKNPEAECVLIVKNGYYYWIIPNCPFCGKKHQHGGGTIGKDDPRQALGSRVPHCADPFREIADAGGHSYNLVEASPGAEPIYVVGGDGCCSNCGKVVRD